jgi:hypothetical protein
MFFRQLCPARPRREPCRTKAITPITFDRDRHGALRDGFARRFQVARAFLDSGVWASSDISACRRHRACARRTRSRARASVIGKIAAAKSVSAPPSSGKDQTGFRHLVWPTRLAVR